jgi:zinc transporter ZupT
MTMTGSLAEDKGILAVIVFVLTALGSSVPWLMTSKCCRRDPALPAEPITNMRAMSFMSCLAGGVILGAGFIEIMPDAQQAWTLYRNGAPEPYPLPFLVSLATFMFLWSIDRVWGHAHTRTHEADGSISLDGNEELLGVVESQIQAHSSKSRRDAYVLSLAMTFHALCDGLALGAESSENKNFDALAVAVVIHKFLDGIAVGVPIYSAFSDAGNRSSVCIIFFLVLFTSIMTPVGIVVGLEWGSSQLAQVLLLSVSAGSFLFIPIIEMIPMALKDEKQTGLKMMVVFVGCGLITLLAIFL